MRFEPELVLKMSNSTRFEKFRFSYKFSGNFESKRLQKVAKAVNPPSVDLLSQGTKAIAPKEGARFGCKANC
jgi:hypothetical protein